MPDKSQTSKPSSTTPRIGLALSGGGFRAALFHLGVIRRLEELGVMKYVQTISAVSGGAIIAAYYVIEMEKRLRQRANNLSDQVSIDTVRLEIFEEITTCFFRGLDHNMRSRALVFMPFYHPLLFIKALLHSGFSRSDIMQREYDKWFYRRATLDHFPSVTWSTPKETADAHPRTGPRVILNATCLLKGERRSFVREPVVGLPELHRVNHNVIPISRVVGASSGVPGLFPPTVVNGDRLVDGGVSDNQGTDALIEEFSKNQITEAPIEESCDPDRNQAEDKSQGRTDVLLVSDASGQMEPVHRAIERALPVLTRTVSVFQFQLRRRSIRNLRSWKDKDGKSNREFAFVHLLLNLKDRDRPAQGGKNAQCSINGTHPNGQTPRVPTEYIAPLAGIRTDLDQFNPIERECLMYHGYTLIDAQIREHCRVLRKWIKTTSENGSWPAYRRPALFCETSQDHKEIETCAGEGRRRRRVQEVLLLGRESFFLFRSIRRHWRKSWACCVAMMAPPVAVVVFAGASALNGISSTATQVGQRLCDITGWCDATDTESIWLQICSLIGDLVGVGIPASVLFYVMLFLTFVCMRRGAKRWDVRDYRDLTSKEPSARWGGRCE